MCEHHPHHTRDNNTIRIRDACVHGLKSVDLDIPCHKLVMVMGLSGNGKSSLASDTPYAEGQRHYVENLLAYARQFLQMMDEPGVDLIEDLSPAVSIGQKSTSHNPHSTADTVTEIHDYLRLSYARIGTPYCPGRNLPLSGQTVSQMVGAVLKLPEDTHVMILAPTMRERKSEFADFFTDLQAQSFARVCVDDEVYRLGEMPKLEKNIKHNIDIVVGRVRVKADIKRRLAEGFETAPRHGNERVLAMKMGDDEEHWSFARFACPVCLYSLPELEPCLFSFNNPMGSCPICNDLGSTNFFDPEKAATHPELSLTTSATDSWGKHNQFYFQIIQSLARHYGFDMQAAWEILPEEVKRVVLHDSSKEVIDFTYLFERGTTFSRSHAFEGIIPNLERRCRKTDSKIVREKLHEYQNRRACPSCSGARLRKRARYVYVSGGPLHEVSAWPLAKTRRFSGTLDLDGNKK